MCESECLILIMYTIFLFVVELVRNITIYIPHPSLWAQIEALDKYEEVPSWAALIYARGLIEPPNLNFFFKFIYKIVY